MEQLRVVILCCLVALAAASCDNCQACVGDNCETCDPGYYRVGNNCYKCIAGCVSCSSSTTCDVCTTGYYRNNENYCSQCSTGCTTCTSHTQCTTCDAGYYRADATSGIYCYKCSDNCTSCTSNPQCTACEAGYYTHQLRSGYTFCYKCSANCASCTALTTCITCEAGYSRVYDSSNNIVCKSTTCPDHCTSCTSNTQCTACSKYTNCTSCKQGHHLSSGQCVPCSGNCKDGAVCRPGDGTCEEGCKPTWTGAQCLDKCPENCLPCSQFEPCRTCKAGFYGNSCQNKCGNCTATATGLLCSKDEGRCVSGCTIGSWGPRCDTTCSNGCLSSICFQDNGRCYRCKPDKYGTQCDQACSEACVHPGNSSNVCRQSDGVCVFGCSAGNKGQKCSGDALPQTATTTDSSSDNTGTVTWIVSVIAAIAVAINVATVIIIVRQRKKMNHGKRQRTNAALDMTAKPGGKETQSYINMAHLDSDGQRQGAGHGQRQGAGHGQRQGAGHQDGTGQQLQASSDNPYADLTPFPGTDEHTYSTADIDP